MTALVYVHAARPADAAVLGELLTLARGAAPDGRVEVLATGASAAGVVEAARELGADLVSVLTDVHPWESARAADVLAPVVADGRERVLLFPDRRFERDVAGRVAVRTDRTVLGDCIELDGEQARLRTAGHDVLVDLRSLGGLAIGLLPWSAEPVPIPRPEIETRELTAPDGVRCSFETVPRDPAAAVARVRDAEVVVTGGRGLDGESGFAALDELTRQIPGAAPGASAAAVFETWAEPEALVGQTGTRVAPRAYLAVGVSGAFFHESATRGREYLVTINRDPEAPFAQLADLAIVGDAERLVPALARALAER